MLVKRRHLMILKCTLGSRCTMFVVAFVLFASTWLANPSTYQTICILLPLQTIYTLFIRFGDVVFRSGYVYGNITKCTTYTMYNLTWLCTHCYTEHCLFSLCTHCCTEHCLFAICTHCYTEHCLLYSVHIAVVNIVSLLCTHCWSEHCLFLLCTHCCTEHCLFAICTHCCTKHCLFSLCTLHCTEQSLFTLYTSLYWTLSLLKFFLLMHQIACTFSISDKTVLLCIKQYVPFSMTGRTTIMVSQIVSPF